MQHLLNPQNKTRTKEEAIEELYEQNSEFTFL